MKQYSTFHFSGYSWNHHAGKITLKYSLDNEVHFEELIFLPEPVTDERLKAKEWEIERLLFALHIIGGISYFKTCLPRAIKVESGQLDLHQAKFWNTVYEKGLGEFFYKNNIDFRGLMNFPALKEKDFLDPAIRKKPVPNPLKRILVPFGGGKDSIATVERLRPSGADLTLLRLEPHPLIDELSHAAGLPMMGVRRQLSGALFDLNKEGALNGHIPITAYLSILASLMAVLYDFDAVAMSNERSADIGNVEFKGLLVNHQWSKSSEFERMLRRYLNESVGTNLEYFSALRPHAELKISEIFSRYPQYFTLATSCNKNWKILESEPMKGRWCGTCPKCAFVFACLAAYLPKKDLETIFGSILYDDESLIPLFQELLGIKNFKPFECVGTPEETEAAFLMARKRGDLNGTAVMKMFESEVLPGIKDPDTLIADTLKPGREYFIPAALQSFLL